MCHLYVVEYVVLPEHWSLLAARVYGLAEATLDWNIAGGIGNGGLVGATGGEWPVSLTARCDIDSIELDCAPRVATDTAWMCHQVNLFGAKAQLQTLM